MKKRNGIFIVVVILVTTGLSCINAIGQSQNIYWLHIVYGGLMGFFVYGGLKFWFFDDRF